MLDPFKVLDRDNNRSFGFYFQGLYCKDYRGDVLDDVHHQAVLPVPGGLGGRGPGLPHGAHQQARQAAHVHLQPAGEI